MRQRQGGDYLADPEVQNYVREVGNKLAAVSDRELPYEFHVVNDSTKCLGITRRQNRHLSRIADRTEERSRTSRSIGP